MSPDSSAPSTVPSELVPKEIQERWQRLVDLMAELCGVPAGLIMHVDPPEIEVFVRSRTSGNPYEPSERADLDTGLYCEEVMRRRGELRVVDALADPDWDRNPDIELGMTYYLGYPLEWPDGTIFGTICILDHKGHPDDAAFKRLMTELQQVVQSDLELVVEVERRSVAERTLRQRQAELEALARVRTSEAALARRAASQSERTLSAVLDHLPAAVFLKTPGGTYDLANAYLHEMLGVGAGTITGMTEAQLHPADQARTFLAQDADVINSGVAQRFEECVEVDGVLRHFMTTKVPFRASPDVAFGILGVALDLTDLKEAEAHREELEEQLRQTRKMEAIGRLAGGIAHDFNNLLTAILGQTELALADGSHALAKDALEAVQSSAVRAARLTGQLLAFGRRQVSQPRALDLNEQLEQLRNMLSRMLPENIRLELELEPGLAPVLADPGQFEQVVINLALNARDAMPSGGRLSISTEAAPVVDGISELESGPHLLLTVRDEGVGMSGEVLEQIFEPFFTTKPMGKGTGLGLATAYGIVRQAGGHIEVDSTPGVGSRFRIWLPSFEGGPSETSTRPEEVRTIDGRGLRVLLCEDDAGVRDLATRILERAGFEVLSAASLAEVRPHLEAGPGRLDLLLTDVIMPDGSGHEVAELVTSSWPGTPVLYMSGYPADVISRQGVLDREVRFIEKPFTSEELLDAVAATVC